MSDTKIVLNALSNVHYQHPDLAKADAFLQAFGLLPIESTGDRIYYRGYGSFPFCYVAEQSPDSKRHFLGGAFAVASRADLERAAQLPGAGPIEAINAPGDGEQVTLYDPAAQPLRLTFGQRAFEAIITPNVTKPFNTAETKPRRGEFQRFEVGPSKVHKIGHFGRALPTADFRKVQDWYTETFNLTVSDAVYNTESGEDETCFLHIDKGDEFVDHHTYFLAASPAISVPHVHHSSFEVQDMDTEMLGHKHLENLGYQNCWGVGRHVLGSQIFDYWFDASGNIIEHYADGDVVNQHTPRERVPAAPGSLAVWGPNVSLGFVTGKPPSAISAEPDIINSVPARGVLPAIAA